MQKIKVQNGKIVYTTTDPDTDLEFQVSGNVVVTKQVTVGNDDSIDGILTTDAGSLNITAFQSLHLEQGAGALTLNGVQWPDGTVQPNPGMFLGVSAQNTLQYYSFVIAFNGSDVLTESALNTAYPDARTGQSVVGPTVIYQCISAGAWRVLGGARAVISVAGKTGVVTLTKADVSLNLVDNTADINKVVSIPQQTALNLKANLAAGNAFTGAQVVASVALTSGASVAVNAALSNNFTLLLGTNGTLANPTNLVDGTKFTIVIKQDTGGSHTLAYGTKYKFSGGTPVLSTAVGAVDYFTATYYAADDILICNLTKAYA